MFVALVSSWVLVLVFSFFQFSQRPDPLTAQSSDSGAFLSSRLDE